MWQRPRACGTSQELLRLVLEKSSDRHPWTEREEASITSPSRSLTYITQDHFTAQSGLFSVPSAFFFVLIVIVLLLLQCSLVWLFRAGWHFSRVTSRLSPYLCEISANLPPPPLPWSSDISGISVLSVTTQKPVNGKPTIAVRNMLILCKDTPVLRECSVAGVLTLLVKLTLAGGKSSAPFIKNCSDGGDAQPAVSAFNHWVLQQDQTTFPRHKYLLQEERHHPSSSGAEVRPQPPPLSYYSIMLSVCKWFQMMCLVSQNYWAFRYFFPGF